jgi:hypothetical protein
MAKTNGGNNTGKVKGAANSQKPKNGDCSKKKN